MRNQLNILISGGGTGGHIYPAIAIANEIKARLPQSNILFVGANGKMEMQKVPKAGYEIKGLDIVGINRNKPFKNLKFPYKLYKSLQQAKKIFKEFQPNIAIGTGGYASGPMLWVAAKKGIPTLIQEQNSFPGITNRLLAKKVNKICTAYDSIPQFPVEKVQNTGNPIRSDLFLNLPNPQLAKEKFGLSPEKTTILSLGGSQGSRSMNQTWQKNVKEIHDSPIQLIWQTGRLDFEKLKQDSTIQQSKNICLTEFIYNMQDAFAAADIIVSRAGAMAISELALVGKPCILLPFPFATEDHQTKNAMALVKKNAAIMLADAHAKNDLWPMLMDLTANKKKQEELSQNIISFGKPNATQEIVNLIFNLIDE